MRPTLTILVVDDNPVNLKLLETGLVREGYRILTARDGKTARELAAAETPDLILLDIVMPGEDGFEVMRHLKQNSETASIPVIFLTGVSDIDAKLTGFDLGAVDYVTKPFHSQEIVARVRLHLKLSHATDSLIAEQAQKLREVTEAQTSLLTTPDMHPEACFGVYYMSLHEAGGDFYDVLPISDGIHGYFVADISGHDIRTSYLTPALKALLHQNCTPIYSAVESIRLINGVLIEILPESKYLTACYARLNRRSGEMTIISAGHPPAVYLPRGGAPHLIDAAGDVLGIFKSVIFGEQTIRVTEGDRFFLYSDGLIEASAPNLSRAQSLDSLLEACTLYGDQPIEEATRQIVAHVFGNRLKPDDDVVLLGVQV